MTQWLETYRGVVNAWECDVVEHFTIAYYFDKFADATRNYFDLIGAGRELVAGAGSAPARWHATFKSELRAGASFCMRTAVTEIDGAALQLGHQMIDARTGDVATWIAETLTLPAPLSPALESKLRAETVKWPGPALPSHADPRPQQGMLAARDRVKPWEIAEDGMMALPSYIHRFSGAGMQALTEGGISAVFMNQQRRGFSTFELDLKMAAGAKAGEMLDVWTAVAHLGKSSLRFAHRMTDRNGGLVATLSQSGVLLDMDARRSTAFPEDIRAAIAKIVTT